MHAVASAKGGCPEADDEIAAIRTLEDIPRTHARLHGDRPAASFDGRALSYAELDARSNRFASALRAEGVGVEDRVAVVLKNGTFAYETLFGARKAGAVQVAVNWRLAAPEMAFIINDSGARVLVIDADLAHLVERIRRDLERPVRVVVAGGGDTTAPLEDYDLWIADFPADDPGHVSAPEDTALQLYTSGTTGLPKGVMLANSNLWAYFAAAQLIFPIRRGGVHLIVLPLFHVAALVWSMRALANGGHCVGSRDFDPAKLLAMIPEYGVNDLIAVPAVLQMLVNGADPATDFSSLDGVGYGGSIMTEKLARSAMDLFGCTIYGMYGSTELAFGCTTLVIDRAVLEQPELLESCGGPLPGTTLHIVDPETFEPLPDGAVGELWVSSAQKAKGYWNRPEATAEVFRSDGWFRTGDMGCLRDNYLYLSDRLKDMIKTGGENVYPAEVERVLAEHPAIEEGVVIGIPDDVWGESVKAFVFLSKGLTADPAEILAFTRERLASFKCPKSVEIVTELPRTASGKVMKNVVREPYWAGRDRRIN